MPRRRDIWLHDFYPLVDPLVFRAKCKQTDARPAPGMFPVRGFFGFNNEIIYCVHSTGVPGSVGARFLSQWQRRPVRIVERVGERHV